VTLTHALARTTDEELLDALAAALAGVSGALSCGKQVSGSCTADARAVSMPLLLARIVCCCSRGQPAAVDIQGGERESERGEWEARADGG